jgi:hypothetical protein
VSWPSGKPQGRRGTEDRGQKKAPSSDICLLLCVLWAGVLGAVLLANSMTKEIGRDEQMYCTAGALMARGQLIYRDFPYISHPPCYPFLLAVLYRIFPTEHYLLVGRLASVLCEILVILAILAVYRSLFGARHWSGLLLGVAATGLYAFNPLVQYASGYAWNHDLVILCVMLALWLFTATDFQSRSRCWRTALIGALLTLATCTRITTGLIEALFLLAVFGATPGGVKDRLWTLLAFSAGALVVLIGPLWVFAQAPHAMWLDLTRIPALCARWLQETGFLYDKRRLSLALLTEPGYFLLLVLAVYLAGSMIRRWSSIRRRDRWNAMLVASVAMMFFVIAYLPPAMWQQYLATPVPFVTATLAFPLAILHRQAQQTGKKRSFTTACCLMAVGAGATLLANPMALGQLPTLFAARQWAPIRLHRVSQEMAGKIGPSGQVLTLGPLYALEGNCGIYPELANPFSYRVADRLSAEERAITHTVGVASLNELVHDRPASAVIVGVEPSYFAFLEEPLRKLVPPDWRRDAYGEGLQVYHRP